MSACTTSLYPMTHGPHGLTYTQTPNKTLRRCAPQRWEVEALGDANMRGLQRGDVLQLERKGYFIVDRPLIRPGHPIVLFATPDGHQRKQPALQASAAAAAAAAVVAAPAAASAAAKGSTAVAPKQAAAPEQAAAAAAAAAMLAVPAAAAARGTAAAAPEQVTVPDQAAAGMATAADDGAAAAAPPRALQQKASFRCARCARPRQ